MSEINKNNPLRLLIVEDNADIAENIADYFEALGHITDFAMDGIVGLHLALTQVYDVIILDVRLLSQWKRAELKIPGAIYEDPREVDSWLEKYPKDKTLVFY